MVSGLILDPSRIAKPPYGSMAVPRVLPLCGILQGSPSDFWENLRRSAVFCRGHHFVISGPLFATSKELMTVVFFVSRLERLISWLLLSLNELLFTFCGYIKISQRYWASVDNVVLRVWRTIRDGIRFQFESRPSGNSHFTCAREYNNGFFVALGRVFSNRC